MGSACSNGRVGEGGETFSAHQRSVDGYRLHDIGSSRHEVNWSDMLEGPSKRYLGILDPMERISEVLFAVIMALTFTCTVGVEAAGNLKIRTMLFAARSAAIWRGASSMRACSLM